MSKSKDSGPARAALSALLANGDVRTQTITIDGVGIVTAENFNGQRFVFCDGAMTSVGALRRKAEKADIASAAYSAGARAVNKMLADDGQPQRVPPLVRT